MIEFYKGNRHDVNHFLKVWAMAKTIGELEGNYQEISFPYQFFLDNWLFQIS